MKTNPQTPRSSSRTPSRLGWLLLIPLLAPAPPIQATRPELAIQHSTNATCLLSWPVTTNSFIVLSATNVGGPWQPCLNHVTEEVDRHCLTVAASCQCQYFKLVEGYYDDFEDGDLDGWTVATLEPTPPLTLEVANGHLRIYGPWPGAGLERHVIFYRTNLMLTNLMMSIDILGWGDDQSNVLLFGRLWPDFVSFPDVYSYGGAVGMRHHQYPNLSALFLLETWPGGYADLVKPISKTDPAKDYRLDYCLDGDWGRVRLWELTNGMTWIDRLENTDSSLTIGWVGFYVVVDGPDGDVDFTLDNFLVYATP